MIYFKEEKPQSVALRRLRPQISMFLNYSTSNVLFFLGIDVNPLRCQPITGSLSSVNNNIIYHFIAFQVILFYSLIVQLIVFLTLQSLYMLTAGKERGEVYVSYILHLLCNICGVFLVNLFYFKINLSLFKTLCFHLLQEFICQKKFPETRLSGSFFGLTQQELVCFRGRC